MSTHVYQPQYYDAITAGSLRSARAVLPLVFDAVSPRSLLDVGSGIGAWSSVAIDLGVEDVRALDGDYVQREQLLIPPDSFSAANLEDPFDLGRRFDLVMTLEVAEHLPEHSAAGFVASLVRHGDAVLFSAAIPRQGGENHLNEQWPEYWAEHFAEHGYVAVDYLRPKVWRHPEVELWYAQNMLLFVRAERLIEFPELASSAREPGAPLSLVHPKLYDIYRPWSGSGYHDPFVAEARGLRSAGATLDMVVFSKDRPAQLELLLRSAKRFFRGWEQVNWSVIFTASSPEYDAGYERVRAEHPEFRYVDERDDDRPFKELTLDAVGQSELVAFIVDDNVFKEPFELESPELAAFRADPSIACLSARMCPRMYHCYPTDEITPIPEFERGTVWDWRSAEGGWGYPMSADFHIFRSAELVPLLSDVDFFNPNSLEAAMAARPLPAPKMICLPEAVVVNLPVNRVQDTAVNRHAGSHAQDELNAEFVKGRRLALGPIAGVRNVSTHHEMELTWEAEAVPAPEPVAAPGSEPARPAGRRFQTLAYVDEVVENPTLLAAYELHFSKGDEATLVLYAPDATEADLGPVLPVLAANGLEGPDAPDAEVVVVPAAEGDAVLPGAVSAVLSGRSPRGGFEALPHFDAEAADGLRLEAGLRSTVTPEPDHGPEPGDPNERFRWELARYRAMPGGEGVSDEDLNPQLGDRTPTTPFDQHYFYQDVWAARRVAEILPGRHVDVGSRVDLVGFLTAICPVAFVDIRPLPAQLEDFESIAGSILELPFPDRSLESVSCLHVAEHIGLGRYGDPLDPLGTLKAAAELQRVLAPGGHLLFSGPVGRARTCFNAHRIHDVHAVVDEFFPELELVEFAGVDDAGAFRRHRDLSELAGAHYACGMYHFVRPGGNGSAPAVASAAAPSPVPAPAVTFSARMEPPTPEEKRNHLLGLLQARGHRLFVESGTYLGDTVAFLRPHVERIVTVEVEPKLHADAVRRFAGDDGIDVILGDALEVVPAIARELDRPALIWLDGHFSGGVTGQGEYVEPAPAILDAFAVAPPPAGSTIIVDDLRMFGRDPEPWPSLDGLVAAARRAFPAANVYCGLDSLVIEA
jgi:SAM-dependent methyltransferase